MCSLTWLAAYASSLAPPYVAEPQTRKQTGSARTGPAARETVLARALSGRLPAVSSGLMSLWAGQGTALIRNGSAADVLAELVGGSPAL